VPRGGGEARSS